MHHRQPIRHRTEHKHHVLLCSAAKQIRRTQSHRRCPIRTGSQEEGRGCLREHQTLAMDHSGETDSRHTNTDVGVHQASQNRFLVDLYD